MLRIFRRGYRDDVLLRKNAHTDWIVMSEFPQFDNAKLMIAASIKHCRTTIEDLPVGQIVVNEEGAIRSIDVSTEKALGYESLHSVLLYEIIVDGDRRFPRKLSPSAYGDLGEMVFLSIDKTQFRARVVCVPGPQSGVFLLSLVFG